MRWARLLAAAALLALTVPVSAEPSPTPSPLVPEAPLQVVVQKLLPRAPQPGDAFQVKGFIRNLGDQPVSALRVRLRLGDRVTTRGGLHEADTDRPVTLVRDINFMPEDDTLEPGKQVPFDIRTTVGALGLQGVGVYPLDVEARGDVGSGREQLGLAPTWVPFFAGEPVQRTRVAVVWPLIDRPRQGIDLTFADDDLAGSLASDGRLGKLLAAARASEVRDCQGAATGPDGKVTPAPTRCEPPLVSFAVDPDLLFAAATMSSPYKVRDGSKTVAGKGEQAAKAWLASLREGAARRGVLALPYADPDVTALTRGSTGTGFKEDLARAGLLSLTEVRKTLEVEPLQTVAWPPAGPITSAATDVLALAGARAFVLDPSAYGQPDSEPARTPSARTVLPASSAGTPLEGLVADDFLSKLVTGSLARDLGPRLAEQRFLAETAIIAAEAPGTSRTLLIAPERRGDVVVGAAAEALRDLGRLPWLCPVTLASVAAGTERCAGRPDVASPVAADRGPLAVARSGELAQTYLGGIKTDRELASQLTDFVLSDKPAVQPKVSEMTARLRRAIARAESSAWRDDPAGARAAAAALRREVQRLVGKVKVYGGQVLLTSATGNLQVSLENTLDVPIQVKVRFSAAGAALVETETGLVEVTAGNAVPATIKAQTQKSGQFVVQAQIYDRNGMPFNPDGSGLAEVIVRSTGYGRLALAVTLGGAGVLFVAAGVRIVRRAAASKK